MERQTASPWSREDRDLLIELRTEMTGVRSDVKEIKNDTAARLTVVEQQKVDRSELKLLESNGRGIHEDHEKRLRTLEDKVPAIGTSLKVWGTAALILLGIVEFLVQLFLWIHYHST